MLRLYSCLVLIALAVFSSASARPIAGPQVEIQVIHGSAALAAFGPIEVYLNQDPSSTTPDAVVTFRDGSAFLTLPAGQDLTVRARLQNAPPPPLPREVTFTAPALPPGRYLVSLAGIPNELLAFYAQNPEGISRAIQLILAQFSPSAPSLSGGGGVSVAVVNAVTDAPALDVTVAETGQVLASGLSFGEAVSAQVAPGTYRVEARRSSDGSLVEAVRFEVEASDETLAVVVSGFLNPSANQGGPALALTATDETGATDPGVVVTAGAEHPSAAGLTVSVSNPLRGASVIRYGLGAAGAVRLALHDALGREVAVLAEGDRQPGEHGATLDAARLAPGVYLLRLGTEAGEVVRRLTVVR